VKLVTKISTTLVTAANLLFVIAISPAAASASETSSAVAEKHRPLSMDVVYSNSVGFGTFVVHENQADGSGISSIMPLYSMSLSFRPVWRISDNWSLRGRFDLEREIISNYYTSTTYDGQLIPSDTQFKLSRSKLISIDGDVGFDLSAAMTLYLPTSIASRLIAQRLGALAPQLGANVTLGAFTFSWSESYTKYFNRYKAMARNVEAQKDYPSGHPRTAEQLPDGLAVTGGMNRDWALTHSLAAAWDIGSGFSASLNFMVLNRFYYTASENELDDEVPHSIYAHPDENQRDLTWGVVEVAYDYNEHLGLAAGVSSFQPAKTADGKSFRFPFFEYLSSDDCRDGRCDPVNNFTSFYLDVTGKF